MRAWTLPVLFLVVCSCAPAPDPSPTGVGPADDKLDPDVVAELAAGRSVIALVELDEDTSGVSQGPLTTDSPGWTDADLAERQARLDSLKADVLSAAPGVKQSREYQHLSVLALELTDRDTLEALAELPRVKRVHSNRKYEATLAESLPLIGQGAAATAGRTGAGATVAVLDTGLDYRRAAFGSCTAAGTPASCRVPFVRDFAVEDGSVDDNGHGTNVAGIVLGVAPGARVIGLDVFSGAGAYSSDILAAIDWCVQNRTRYNIVALNMSLGGGGSTVPCTSDVFAAGITTAKRAGISSAVASGNNGYTNAISSPACAPDAVSVGAVYDSAMGAIGWSPCFDSTTAADQVTCFSNSASFLKVLAPGSVITAAGITMSGTSQAAPHVAGALAVVAAAYPLDTPDQRLQRLTSTGSPITDRRNGVTRPRIDVGRAATGCAFTVSPLTATASLAGGTLTFNVSTAAGCAWSSSSPADWATLRAPVSGSGNGTVTVAVAANGAAARSATLTLAGRAVTISQAGDTTAPRGTVVINGGAAWARTTAATLTLAATDDVGVRAMCISTSASCTAWQAYATSASVTLPAGNGVKTVQALFKDAAGNVSAAATDTLSLDATAPTDGTVTVARGNGQLTLTWTASSDANSGVASYGVAMATGAVPTSCAGAVAVSGAAAARTLTRTGLINGTSYGFRVCALDVAGNVSTGVTVSAAPAPELVAPTGTLTVAGTATRSTAVTLTLRATDASGVASMCVSESTTCSAWVRYATQLAFTLSSGSGVKTLRAFFRDVWGNTSAAVTASITLDVTAPAGGVLNATALSRRVALSWSGITDANTSVASYTLVGAAGSVAPACAAGPVLYQGTAASFTHVGLTAGQLVSYRLCATDAVGNVSAGVTRSATATP